MWGTRHSLGKRRAQGYGLAAICEAMMVALLSYKLIST
jgi:hypothetical protein